MNDYANQLRRDLRRRIKRKGKEKREMRKEMVVFRHDKNWTVGLFLQAVFNGKVVITTVGDFKNRFDML